MKKTFLKAFAATLAAVSAFAITANADFAKSKTYTEGQFTDVPATEWYASSVKDAFEFGIMNGDSATTFNPNGTLTVAEGITVATRLYETMTGKAIAAVNGGEWYKQYVDYAIANGLIASDKFDNYDRNIRRSEMAELMAAASGDMAALNSVTNLPDVPGDAEFYNAVVKLYNAGILTGNDAYGTFAPESNLLRSEISAMAVRIADSSKRVQKTFEASPVRAYYDAYAIIDVESGSLGRNGLANGWNYDYRFNMLSSNGRDINHISDSTDEIFGSLKRDFDPEYAGTLDLDTYVEVRSAGGGVYIAFKNEALEDVVSVEEKDGKWVLVGTNTTVSDITIDPVKNAEYTVNMRIDLDKNTATAVINNTVVGTVNIKDCEVSRLEMGSRKIGTGYICMKQCYLNKNYALYDRFIANKTEAGQVPAEWNVTGDFKLQYTQGTLFDHYSVKAESKAGTVSTAARSFDAVAGKVLFDVNTLLPEKTDGASYALTCGGNEVLKIETVGGKLVIGGTVLHDYTPNVWQELYVEADTRTGKALIKINGKVRATVDFAAPYFDGVKIAFAPAVDAVMWFDDLEVSNLIDHADYPAVPKVASDDNYNIGMNFCYLWRDSNSMEGWDATSPFEEFDTYLGFYDEGLRETADWEIKYMAEHGIDFIHACWYAPQTVVKAPIKQSRVSHAAIHDGYMNAKYSDLVDFCIMWETGYKGCDSIEGFYTYLWPYWKEYYFSDDRYATLDNKAILTIWGDGSAAAKCLGGEDKLKEALQFMDAELKKMGYDGIVVLFSTTANFSESSYNKIAGYGVEASTYAYHWSKPGESGDHQINRNKALTENASKTDAHHIPTVSIGFNDIARNESRSGIVSVSDHLAVCEDMKNILAKSSTGTWKDKTIFVSTWNEYSEGTYIFPTASTHFDYLENIRKVFTKDTTDHSAIDVKPTKAQVDRVGHLYPPHHTPIRWLQLEAAGGSSLNGEKNTVIPSELDVIKKFDLKTEFSAGHGVTNAKQEENLFTGSATQDDFAITAALLNLKSEQASVIHVRLKVGIAAAGEIFFTTEENKTWDNKKHTTFVIPKANEFVDCYIDMSKVAQWNGTITAIRIDPCTAKTDFEVSLVEILGKADVKLAKEAKVVTNGEELYFTFVPVYDEEGDITVVGEARKGFYSMLGLYHEFDRFTGTLKLYNRANDEFIFVDGSDKVTVNGKEQALGYTFIIRDGLPQFKLKKLVDLVGWKYTEEEDVIKVQAASDAEYKELVNRKPNQFEFNIEGDIEGFTCQHTSISQQNGKLVGAIGTTGTVDPAVSKTVNFSADDYGKCVIGIVYTEVYDKHTPQLFFHHGSGFTGAKCVNGKMDLTGKKYGDVIEVTFDLRSNKDYTGTIKAIRIDPHSALAPFEIDYIRFIESNISEEMANDYTVVKSLNLKTDITGYGYNLSVQEEGRFEATSTSADPATNLKGIDFAADTVDFVHIRMRVDKTSAIQFYFTTDTDGTLGENKTLGVSLKPSENMVAYYLPVSTHEKWQGTIKSIRFDPVVTTDTLFVIEKIEFLKKK